MQHGLAGFLLVRNNGSGVRFRRCRVTDRPLYLPRRAGSPIRLGVVKASYAILVAAIEVPS